MVRAWFRIILIRCASSVPTQQTLHFLNASKASSSKAKARVPCVPVAPHPHRSYPARLRSGTVSRYSAWRSPIDRQGPLRPQVNGSSCSINGRRASRASKPSIRACRLLPAAAPIYVDPLPPARSTLHAWKPRAGFWAVGRWLLILINPLPCRCFRGTDTTRAKDHAENSATSRLEHLCEEYGYARDFAEE